MIDAETGERATWNNGLTYKAVVSHMYTAVTAYLRGQPPVTRQGLQFEVSLVHQPGVSLKN